MNIRLRSLLGLLSLLLLIGLSSCASRPATANPDTIIYIVRHAEKDLGADQPDPPLSSVGRQRALTLRDTLRQAGALDAIFSTSTVRTRATAEPAAARFKLPLLSYDVRELNELADRIRREYRGKRVLVVGHSNTILETAQALGCPRPAGAVAESQYDYLLVVRVPFDFTKPATVATRRYGVRSPGL